MTAIIYGENKIEVPQDTPQKAEIIENMPMSEYQSRCNMNRADWSVSKSMLHELLDCPARFKHKYIDGFEEPEADHLNMGCAVHTLALEPQHFEATYYVIKEGVRRDKRTDAYKAEIANAAGRIMLTAGDFEKVKGMAKALGNDPVAVGLLDGPGYIEASILYTCPRTGLRKRVRPDWFRKDGKLVVNIKTSSSAKPDQFYKTAYDFAYDVGAAMELEAMDALFGPDPERNYVLLVVETEAPHIISAFDTRRPMTLGDDENNTPTSYAEVGATRLEKALARFIDCRNADRWPGYVEGVDPMRVPGWMMKRVLEKGE